MLIIFVTMCGTDKGIPASLSHGHSSMTHHKQTTTWKATLGNSSQNATSHPLSGQKHPLKGLHAKSSPMQNLLSYIVWNLAQPTTKCMWARPILIHRLRPHTKSGTQATRSEFSTHIRGVQKLIKGMAFLGPNKPDRERKRPRDSPQARTSTVINLSVVHYAAASKRSNGTLWRLCWQTTNKTTITASSPTNKKTP